MEGRGKTQKNSPDLLTGIVPSYTLAATHEGSASEVEDLMVKNFIDTLAEIALAVASRKVNQ